MMTRLALRGMLAHRMRLGLTALAVILGVAFISGTLIFSKTMDNAVDSAYSDLGAGTDAVVRAKKTLGSDLGDTDRPVPASLLATVRQADGVAKAHGTLTGFATVLNVNGDVAGDPPQLGTDWTDDPDFSLLHLREGAGPRTPTEVAIDVTTARAAGHEVGDQVKVALQSGLRTFTLSGIFKFGPSGTPDPSMVAFQATTAQQVLMDKPGTYRQIAVRAKDGLSQDTVRDAVAKVLPAGFEAVTGQQAIDERTASVKDILGLLNAFVLSFAGISVFVGSFIIFNTFGMLVAQRTRELALLRAIGASRRQVIRSVMGEAVGVGFVGSTAGLLLGIGLAAALPPIIGALGNELPAGSLAVTGSAVAWSYTVGMTVTLLAAFFPALRGARIPPIAALRDEVPAPTRSLRFRAITGGGLAAVGATGFAVSGGASLPLAGAGIAVLFIGISVLNPIVSAYATRIIGWPFARLFGLPGRLSRENAQRNPRRTAATASALMIGLTLISGASVISQSMLASADRQLDAGLVADYRVTSKSSTLTLSRQTQQALARTPGVQSAIAVSSPRLKLNGRVVTATAGDPHELMRLHRLRLEAGVVTLGRDELLVSHATAKANSWQVGSSVPGEYGDGTEANLRVTGIYAGAKDILETAPTTILGTAGHQAHYPDQIDVIDLIAAPGADLKATETALESALAPWPNANLKDRDGIKDQYGAEIRILLRLVLALLALSVLIAALGIINTLALAVIERTREIGLLRAIGLQRRQVRQMIRYEAVVISVFGALLGLVIGVSFAALVQAFASDDGMEVLSIPVFRLALYVLVAAVIGVLSSLWPARHASRMNILQAIETR